jgi:hypothetical protein
LIISGNRSHIWARWSGQYDLWDEKWDAHSATWLDIVIVARLGGRNGIVHVFRVEHRMVGSTRAEIGACGGMIDSLGRTFSRLILFCEAATFSATARRNRAEPWSDTWTGRRRAPTRAVAAAGTYFFSPPGSSEGECSTWNIRSPDLSLSQTRG